MTTSLLMSKIVDISAARRRRDERELVVSLPDNDMRRERRCTSNERLFVQIVTSDDQDLIGTTISCQAMDVSASGLRIRTARPIPAGCHLDLWVDNRSRPGKFFLSSDVRWTRGYDGFFEAGVELHDSAATDIADWRDLHAG